MTVWYAVDALSLKDMEYKLTVHPLFCRSTLMIPSDFLQRTGIDLSELTLICLRSSLRDRPLGHCGRHKSMDLCRPNESIYKDQSLEPLTNVDYFYYAVLGAKYGRQDCRDGQKRRSLLPVLHD